MASNYPEQASNLRSYPFPTDVGMALRVADLGQEDPQAATQPPLVSAQEVADIMTTAHRVTRNHMAVRQSILTNLPGAQNNLFHQRQQRSSSADALARRINEISQAVTDATVAERGMPGPDHTAAHDFHENLSILLQTLAAESQSLADLTNRDSSVEFYTQSMAQMPAVQTANRFEVLMNVAATGLAWPRMTPFHVAHNYMRRISEDIPALSSSSQAAISGQAPPPTVPQAYGRLATLARAASQEPPAQRRRVDEGNPRATRTFSPSPQPQSALPVARSATSPAPYQPPMGLQETQQAQKSIFAQPLQSPLP
jgi:hypothetical protein